MHTRLPTLLPACVLGVAIALFYQPGQATRPAGGPPVATIQVEGAEHRGPRAYHEMCVREPELCRYDRHASADGTVSAPAELTASRWHELQWINQRLNAAILPVEDWDNQGVADFWTIGIERGDCEDYIIAKKHALVQAGWAPDQVLYAVVESRLGRGHHAVLIVRTHLGDYVLDNLTDLILPWEKSGYRFVLRQSAEAPQRWVHVRDALQIAGATGADLVSQ